MIHTPNFTPKDMVKLHIRGQEHRPALSNRDVHRSQETIVIDSNTKSLTKLCGLALELQVKLGLILVELWTCRQS